MITVDAQGLTKSFGGTTALAGCTLDVGPGVTGLLGPNGAGKTTFLRLVATVLAPDAGGLRVLGHDPGDADGRLAIRRRLGYVPQEPGFYGNFTVFEFVDYIAILKEMTDRRARHEDVRRVLRLVDLEPVARRKIRKLSGGMRRRLVLAQALLGNPSLLVLDEPTAGLDPEQRLRFREVVSQIAAEHTVLLSTHQTEDVAALCDRVVVLHGGRLLYDGDVAGLAANAAGRVWVADAPDARAGLSWRTGNGRYRLVGTPPGGAELTEPTIEDGYLLLVGAQALDAVA